MRAAYDVLPEVSRRMIDGLIVDHSIFYSREKVGFTYFFEATRAALPPVPQVLVRQHAATGRNALYLASYVSHVIGWPIDEGRRLLAELMDFATQPVFVYKHVWREGDLIVWDNRYTMHCLMTT
jgi:alpha-ketoglutarate-dependent 2,4-dichlorophenoxyacetate dioxygenase